MGKRSDHSISGSSGFLDIAESFGDLVSVLVLVLVLALVLVVPAVLIRAFSGLMSSSVAVET